MGSGRIFRSLSRVTAVGPELESHSSPGRGLSLSRAGGPGPGPLARHDPSPKGPVTVTVTVIIMIIVLVTYQSRHGRALHWQPEPPPASTVGPALESQ